MAQEFKIGEAQMRQLLTREFEENLEEQIRSHRLGEISTAAMAEDLVDLAFERLLGGKIGR